MVHQITYWHHLVGAHCLDDGEMVPATVVHQITYRHHLVGAHCHDDGEMVPATASILDTAEAAVGHQLQCNAVGHQLQCDLHHTVPKTPTYELLHPFFLHATRMIDTYAQMFVQKTCDITSPLEGGDHPELDTSPELSDEGLKKYQSMIGSLQWAISLGRFDIATAVMTMSSFRASPREGHLDRLKRMYGYLSKMHHAIIFVCTEEPDYSEIPDQYYDWAQTAYGDVEELLPSDSPEPIGKPVTLTTYVDANLYHDTVPGCSASGIIYLINKTPFDWYSKKQSTVETATYGSEFVAARIATEHIIEHRTMLHYLGIPVNNKTYMFGD